MMKTSVFKTTIISVEIAADGGEKIFAGPGKVCITDCYVVQADSVFVIQRDVELEVESLDREWLVKPLPFVVAIEGSEFQLKVVEIMAVNGDWISLRVSLRETDTVPLEWCPRAPAIKAGDPRFPPQLN